jgi:hypothetical protein
MVSAGTLQTSYLFCSMDIEIAILCIGFELWFRTSSVSRSSVDMPSIARDDRKSRWIIEHPSP